MLRPYMMYRESRAPALCLPGFTSERAAYSFIRFFPSQKDAQDTVTAVGGCWVFVKIIPIGTNAFLEIDRHGWGWLG